MEIPRLCTLANEKPVIAFEDEIYEVADTFSPAGNFISIRGVEKSLIQSESLRKQEEIQYSPVLKKNLAEAYAALLSQEKALASELAGLKNVEISNDILEFARKCIVNAHLTEITGPPKDEFEYKKIETRVCENYHDPADKSSKPLLSKAFDFPILLLGRMCYKLLPSDSQNGSKTFVRIKNKKHTPEFVCTIEMLGQEYCQQVQQHFERRIKKETASLELHLREEMKRRDQLKEKLLQIPKFDDIGYLFDGSDYYVWRLRPAFQLHSAFDNGSDFLFPTCKVGIRIFSMGKGIVDFDRFETYLGGIRVLEAKSVVNGVETGEMQSMKGKEYHFPSARFQKAKEGNTPADKYTYLCIHERGAAVYTDYNPWSNRGAGKIADPKMPVDERLRALLNEAVKKMENGYIEGAPKMKVYHPITTNELYFRNFRIMPKKEGDHVNKA